MGSGQRRRVIEATSRDAQEILSTLGSCSHAYMNLDSSVTPLSTQGWKVRL